MSERIVVFPFGVILSVLCLSQGELYYVIQEHIGDVDS